MDTVMTMDSQAGALYDSQEALLELVEFSLDIGDLVFDLFEEGTAPLRSDNQKHWQCDGERVAMIHDDETAMKVTLRQIIDNLSLKAQILDVIKQAGEYRRKTQECIVRAPDSAEPEVSIEDLSNQVQDLIGVLERKAEECIFVVNSLNLVRS